MSSLRFTPPRLALVVGLALLLSGTAWSSRLWPQPALGPSASGQPEVLFTFDDGPHEDTTPLVLDALHKYGVQAIFFVTGWRVQGDSPGAVARQAAARRALAEGHALGNHTMRHARLCGPLKRERAEWEIDENNRLLAKLARMAIIFYRTPYGGRCLRLDEILAQRGMEHVHWDMDAREYLTHDRAATRSYFISQLRRLEGRAVILMHDTQITTARVLPELLQWIVDENARRTKEGLKEIRILSYADIVRERMPPGLVTVLDHSREAMAGFASRVVRRLVGPLAAVPRAKLAPAFDLARSAV